MASHSVGGRLWENPSLQAIPRVDRRRGPCYAATHDRGDAFVSHAGHRAAAGALAISMLLAGCSHTPAGRSAEACRAVDTSLTHEQRRSEAARVARALERNPASLAVTRAMRQGEWTLVWATPDDREAGVFFLRRGAEPELVETWGGVATPEERDDIEKWALGLPGGPPAELAQCFAAQVSTGGALE